MKRLQGEREKRTAEMAKIDTLDEKIPLELRSLREKVQHLLSSVVLKLSHHTLLCVVSQLVCAEHTVVYIRYFKYCFSKRHFLKHIL